MGIATNPHEHLSNSLARFAPLSDQDRAAVARLTVSRRTLEAATYLVREGDAPVHCAILMAGFIYRQKITGTGARQIVSLHIPGDLVDIQNLYVDASDHSVQTLTRAELAFIPRREVEALVLANQAIGHAVLRGALTEASMSREWILNIGRRDARTRLAHVLCEFARRLDAAGLARQYGYELPMTQEQLGDALGLTPVHVNRTIRALEAEGLIQRTKRFISFPDWRRMRDEADFNERYLHLPEQAL